MTSQGRSDENGSSVHDTQEAQVREALRTLLDRHDPATLSPEEFLGAQYDAGLAWVHFPPGRGGLGVNPKLQTLVDEHMIVLRAPRCFPKNPIGYGMGAPTLLAHGSEDQQDRYLRRLFTCEDTWCQLFSEPSAGSDVASLATSAVRDGDEWIVNGQKVWTTLAHLSRYGLLVTRTAPEQPKHRGLTYFVLDMHAPGVQTQPLRQMTGDAEFNEVFLTDVRIPDSERLSAEGDGWKVAITTLMNERVALGGSQPRVFAMEQLMELWQEKRPDDKMLRDRMTRLYIASEVCKYNALRSSANRKAGTPGPEGSVGKLFVAELNQRIWNFCIELEGANGMLYPSYTDLNSEHPHSTGQPFLRAQANTIEGGTSNIMRNILGERVLQLPGEPRPDKGIPWRDVPRS